MSCGDLFWSSFQGRSHGSLGFLLQFFSYPNLWFRTMWSSYFNLTVKIEKVRTHWIDTVDEGHCNFVSFHAQNILVSNGHANSRAIALAFNCFALHIFNGLHVCKRAGRFEPNSTHQKMIAMSQGPCNFIFGENGYLDYIVSSRFDNFQKRLVSYFVCCLHQDILQY